MRDDDILKYELGDFFWSYTDDVRVPPEDFERWIEHPSVKRMLNLFAQPLLAAPKSESRILSGVDGKEREIINLTSYNYLGLSTHPEVIQATKEAADQYGLSASGAPLLSGTFDLHLEFERRLAEFKGYEACLSYSSGNAGNMGTIQALLRKNDMLIMDSKAHQSIIDGGTLAGAKQVFFEHNNSDSLEKALEKSNGRRRVVAVEGVYSMDGDMARLPEIVELCQHYNAPLYVDEAHSTLMFGANGRGVGEHFGLEDKIDITFGTLSKSFGGVGGFVCSTERLLRYLKPYANPWAFSCSSSPVVIGGLMKALEVATRDSVLRDKMWENTRYLHKNLSNLGLDLGSAESQIIPIIIGSAGELLFNMAEEMQKRGLFLQPVLFPAVPSDQLRFRISVSAQLTKDQMDRALNIIEDVVAKGLKKAKK